jgi:hypothetical protein
MVNFGTTIAYKTTLIVSFSRVLKRNGIITLPNVLIGPPMMRRTERSCRQYPTWVVELLGWSREGSIIRKVLKRNDFAYKKTLSIYNADCE